MDAFIMGVGWVKAGEVLSSWNAFKMNRCKPVISICPMLAFMIAFEGWNLLSLPRDYGSTCTPHMRIEPSALPEASSLPSKLKATLVTRLV